VVRQKALSGAFCYNQYMFIKGTPKPGDMGFSSIEGMLGFWIGLGQYLNGDGSKYTHVFIVLDDDTIMEAMPKGAQIVPIAAYDNKAVFLDWGITDAQRKLIVEEARKCEGAKYNFIDYLALALARFGFKPRWLIKRIKSNNKLICSALADMVYNKAGIQLFSDGRIWHDVTPGDLINRYLERNWFE
jgi:hypothetical protein